MALWQGLSKRSKTGRRLRFYRCKRKFEIGREAHLTTIGPVTIKKVRTKGNNRKTRAKTIDIAYVVDNTIGNQTAALIPDLLFIFRFKAQFSKVSVRYSSTQLVVILAAVECFLDVLAKWRRINVIKKI